MNMPPTPPLPPELERLNRIYIETCEAFDNNGFVRGLRRLRVLQQSLSKPFAGFALETFHTAAPVAWGPYAAKLRLVPTAVPPGPRATPADWSEDVVARLAEEVGRQTLVELEAEARGADDPLAYGEVMRWLKLTLEELRSHRPEVEKLNQLVEWLIERRRESGDGQVH
jgi:hypothetical protein